MTVVLASGSPRRREILTELGIQYEVVVSDVIEIHEGEPEAMVLENARRKAAAGARAARSGSLVIGVDTDVFLDGAALGKPVDRREAREREPRGLYGRRRPRSQAHA